MRLAAADRAQPPRGHGRRAAGNAARAVLAAAGVAPLLLLLAPGCDGGLKPEYASTYCAAGVCGTVHFRGAVPDSTEWVRVVVYAAIPESASQLTSFAGFSDVLPLGTDSAHYSCCILPLPAGSYAWVIVVWKKLGALDVSTAPDLLREIGGYQDPADTTQFGVVAVPSGGGTGGIDMVADYGRMRSISDFFPSAPDLAGPPAGRARRAARAAARGATASPARAQRPRGR